MVTYVSSLSRVKYLNYPKKFPFGWMTEQRIAKLSFVPSLMKNFQGFEELNYQLMYMCE